MTCFYPAILPERFNQLPTQLAKKKLSLCFLAPFIGLPISLLTLPRHITQNTRKIIYPKGQTVLIHGFPI